MTSVEGQALMVYILYNDNGGNWNFWTGDGNPGWDTMSGGAVTPNAWTHLALTFDADTDTKSIFIDGALAASETAPNQYSPNGTVEFESLHIGAGQDNGLNFYFSGNIDDVSIWNTALDEAAIQNIKDNGVASAHPRAHLARSPRSWLPRSRKTPTQLDTQPRKISKPRR